MATICALLVYNCLMALRVCKSSFAIILHDAMSFLLAASLQSLTAFCSSRWMSLHWQLPSEASIHRQKMFWGLWQRTVLTEEVFNVCDSHAQKGGSPLHRESVLWCRQTQIYQSVCARDANEMELQFVESTIVKGRPVVGKWHIVFGEASQHIQGSCFIKLRSKLSTQDCVCFLHEISFAKYFWRSPSLGRKLKQGSHQSVQKSTQEWHIKTWKAHVSHMSYAVTKLNCTAT